MFCFKTEVVSKTHLTFRKDESTDRYSKLLFDREIDENATLMSNSSFIVSLFTKNRYSTSSAGLS